MKILNQFDSSIRFISKEVPVIIRKAYEKFVDVIGGYPVPTRSGYAFEGWQRDDFVHSSPQNHSLFLSCWVEEFPDS